MPSMKRHLSSLAASFALFAMVAASAQAEIILRENQNVLPFASFVPCTNGGAGEVISGTVKHTALVSETIDASGGVHFHLHVKWIGDLTGSETGQTYSYNENLRITQHIGAEGLPFDDAFSSHLRSRGPEGNVMIKVTGHFHVTPNGEVSVDFFHSDLTCQD